MNKLALAAAVSAVLASPAFATYTGTASSVNNGLGHNSNITVNAATDTQVWYVDPASGTASNKTAPGIQLIKASDWTFDFTNLAAVTFTGNIQMGNYKTQTSVTGAAIIDGRQTYTGVTTGFSGIGSYNEATNTFTYNFFNNTTNGGGASTYSETAPATCSNGATSAAGKVCGSFASASKAWEGLSLNFVFSEDRSTFSGSLIGTDTSGTGLSSNTTTIAWQVAGTQPIVTPPVPVPAAAWLFGSGLLGLAGTARRRSKKA